VGRSEENEGPRHRAEGPADARPAASRPTSARHALSDGAVEPGVFGHNTDVVPERRRIERRGHQRRPADVAAVLPPDEERRAAGNGRRRAEQALDGDATAEGDGAPDGGQELLAEA
jgi:hypothetical protein